MLTDTQLDALSVRELPAGRELDELVVRRVMNGDGSAVPAYSIDDRFISLLMNRVRCRGWSVWIGPGQQSGEWEAQVKPTTDNAHEWITASTIPLLVCRAALLTTL